MSKEDESTPADDMDVAVQYRDERVLVDGSELGAAVRAVRQAVTEDTAKWVQPTYSHDGKSPILAEEQARAVAIAVLRAINAKRCGEPEGTVAVDTKGRTARRYYSDRLGRNVWLVTEPPSDKGVEIDDADSLSFDYKIVHRPAWVVEQ